MSSTLTTTDHSRDIAGLKYIYPVISRRASGLSIGVNFNTNNACNWRCVYCQVPELTLGTAPNMDFKLLEDELRFFLNNVVHGDFYQRFNIDEDQRVIKDIAISGNGEPTTLKDFAKAVELIGAIATELGVFPQSNFVLITNGSLVHLPRVQQGLKALKNYGGEVWFKFDSATDAGRTLINHCAQSWQASLKNLALSASLCPTKLQTCLLDYDGLGFSDAEQEAFLNLLGIIKKNNISITTVMLYTLARASLQPEANLLKKLPLDELSDFAIKIKALDYAVSINA
ncbi:Radical SAM domain protein [Crenothrix polyspora]|uniref:Radical SAM domain protein n=1 Tax=Crenothrix polyspora TaxID=360316 RepID=A0A1R4H901_9GAMM|nr:radical SAM protein [Crenothrix polyspora]SJM92657.1 Radical SAM domain protein [Crenothrix polyspora]